MFSSLKYLCLYLYIMYRKVFIVYLFLVMDSLDSGIQMTFKMLFFILISTDDLKKWLSFL